LTIEFILFTMARKIKRQCLQERNGGLADEGNFIN
jgi:hypothetical protein